MGRHLDQEQADEFSIGAMEDSAAEEVAAHIAVCEACARLVAESDRVAATLLLGIPRTPPSPELRNRVFRRAGITRPRPVVWATRLATAGAGIAAVFVAIAALTGMVSMREQINDLKEEDALLNAQLDEALSQRVEIAALTLKLDDQARESAELQAAARLDRDLLVALLSPDSKVAEVYPVDKESSALGRLIWDPEQRRVWVIASRLTQLADGQTYQLWVDSGGTWVTLGTFTADATGFARFQALIPQGIEGYDQAVVTIETGLASELSGPAVLVMDFSAFRR